MYIDGVCLDAAAGGEAGASEGGASLARKGGLKMLCSY